MGVIDVGAQRTRGDASIQRGKTVIDSRNVALGWKSTKVSPKIRFKDCSWSVTCEINDPGWPKKRDRQ